LLINKCLDLIHFYALHIIIECSCRASQRTTPLV
jgi:hypothetical protein